MVNLHLSTFPWNRIHLFKSQILLLIVVLDYDPLFVEIPKTLIEPRRLTFLSVQILSKLILTLKIQHEYRAAVLERRDKKSLAL